ncbi:MAG: choice-of-anchor L domain-containing protein [Flavobacteriales bacterium]|nr:choice-of-anchor L domain-containing protein [Flavobacteriales bacterium]
MKHLTTILFITACTSVFAQTRVSDYYPDSRATPPTGFYINQLNTVTASLLDSIIVGGCVQVSNFQFHGPANAFGIFIDSVDAIGMNGGILLTTGRANVALGPDDSNSAGYNQQGSGHPDLTALSGGFSSFDAVWVEFDFTPFADTIFASDFVFGSEEYPEYVNGGYNDFFGFFISGPGISGPYSNGAENIALVPNSSVPIAIDNVNNGYSGSEPATGPCTNCQYYIDNSSGPYIQYDAFTTVMSLEYPVIPGETYHFMIAISDIGDDAFDSGVFIESESFCGNTWFQYAQFVAQDQGGNGYQFQNQSFQADAYLWDFGDGQTSEEENPFHAYSAPGDYEVTLTCSNLCFDTATTVLLNVGTVTDINELVSIEAQIRNIGQDEIALNCQLPSSAIVQLTILDMEGRTQWSESVGTTTKFSKTMDISSLRKGIYLMRIEANNSSSVLRFVKM